jgi:hypothetical protein
VAIHPLDLTGTGGPTGKESASACAGLVMSTRVEEGPHRRGSGVMGRRPAVRLIAMAIVLLLMAAFCKWCSTRCKCCLGERGP